MPKLQLATILPPLPRTYWVCDGLFLAGAYAGQPEPISHQVRVQALFAAGARTFINLMEENETNNDGKPFVDYVATLNSVAAQGGEAVQCFRYPIVDRHITTQNHMREILNAIDASIFGDRPVYVHCFGGIGRTGTTVCCWLLRHGLATKDNVFAVLSKLRQVDTERATWPAPENATQRQFVLDWPEQPRRAPQVQQSQPVKQVQQVGRADASRSTVQVRGDWFSRLFGFSERRPEEVRSQLTLDGSTLKSLVNGKSYDCGRLEIVSLAELRARVAAAEIPAGKLQLTELVGDAQGLHADERNRGAVFQVASQFNLLEMVSPSVTPEQGIGIYEDDPTQGPACAIACGAGTAYRNYFVELAGTEGEPLRRGQSEQHQVDCLAAIGAALGNEREQLWEMRNGYALPSEEGLRTIDSKLQRLEESELDALRGKLQIGIQWNAQVTLPGCSHAVTQVYCSALPVAYSGLPSSLWSRFARLVLEAAYEATFAVAVLNAAQPSATISSPGVADSANENARRTLYLTLLGGGAFGNDPDWILSAIARACQSNRSRNLEVKIVSYRRSIAAVSRLVESLMSSTTEK